MKLNTFYPITHESNQTIAFTTNITPYVSDSIEMVFRYTIMVSFDKDAKDKYELYDSSTYYFSEQNAKDAADEHISNIIHKSGYNINDLIKQVNNKRINQ